MAMSQALALTGDLKLGWYTSIVSDIAKNGKSANDLPSRHEYAEQTQYETIVDLCSTCLRAKLLAPFSEQSQTVSCTTYRRDADSKDFTLVSVLSTKHQYLDGTVSDPTQQWTGRAPNIFFSASILYGAVAPGRFFVDKYAWLYLG